MSTEQENKKLKNIGARLAGCLWNYHGICPECGNNKTSHMPSCKQTYEKDFSSPSDAHAVFIKAFDLEK